MIKKYMYILDNLVDGWWLGWPADKVLYTQLLATVKVH